MTSPTPAERAERERQRVAHLVLCEPRPRPAKQPSRKTRRKGAAAPAPVVLAPGIEDRVALRERWSHKTNGTPETHEHADRIRRRAGSLARLHGSGTINADQLAAAQEIAETYEAIGAAVGVKSSFAGQRVDSSFRPELADGIAGARVARELAYDRWRASVDGPIGAVLAMIVADRGLTLVAREYRMSDRRARQLLVASLDLWWAARRHARGAGAADL